MTATQPTLTDKTLAPVASSFLPGRVVGARVFLRQPGTQRRERQGPGWFDSEEGKA